MGYPKWAILGVSRWGPDMGSQMEGMELRGMGQRGTKGGCQDLGIQRVPIWGPEWGPKWGPFGVPI